jgi:hypothetical protein
MKKLVIMFLCVFLYSCKVDKEHVKANAYKQECNFYKQALNTIIDENLMFSQDRKMVIVNNLFYRDDFDKLLYDFLIKSQYNNSLINTDLENRNINVSEFTNNNVDTLLYCEDELDLSAQFISYNSTQYDSILNLTLQSNDILLITFSNIGYTDSYNQATLYLKSRYRNGNKEYIFFFYEQQMDKTYKIITYYRLRF